MSPLFEPLLEILANVLGSALAGAWDDKGRETLYDDSPRESDAQSTEVKPGPSVRKSSVDKALPSHSVSGNEPTAR